MKSHIDNPHHSIDMQYLRRNFNLFNQLDEKCLQRITSFILFPEIINVKITSKYISNLINSFDHFSPELLALKITEIDTLSSHNQPVLKKLNRYMQAAKHFSQPNTVIDITASSGVTDKMVNIICSFIDFSMSDFSPALTNKQKITQAVIIGCVMLFFTGLLMQTSDELELLGGSLIAFGIVFGSMMSYLYMDSRVNSHIKFAEQAPEVMVLQNKKDLVSCQNVNSYFSYRNSFFKSLQQKTSRMSSDRSVMPSESSNHSMIADSYILPDSIPTLYNMVKDSYPDIDQITRMLDSTFEEQRSMSALIPFQEELYGRYKEIKNPITRMNL